MSGRRQENPETRVYHSPIRQQRAQQTRDKVLTAAGDLFLAQGYTGTTVREIAARAGVALQTASSAGTKADLMAAVLEREMVGEVGAQFRAQQEIQAIIVEPDADEALRRYARFLTAGQARIARLWHTALLAGDADPAIAAALDRSELKRRGDIEAGSHLFVARGVVSEDRRVRFATVLTQLTDPETFYYFVVRRGWTEAEYAEWFLEAIYAHR